MKPTGDRSRKRVLEQWERGPASDPDDYGYGDWNQEPLPQAPTPAGPASDTPGALGPSSSSVGPELTVDDFFQPGGILSGRMERWEDRPAQWEMASGVAAALKDRRHMIVEAGTGTGKTLAYLIPLVLAGLRAVISTGTKNLQEQLLRKDVPLLENLLGHKLRVALMKGRGNFVCLQK